MLNVSIDAFSPCTGVLVWVSRRVRREIVLNPSSVSYVNLVELPTQTILPISRAANGNLKFENKTSVTSKKKTRCDVFLFTEICSPIHGRYRFFWRAVF